MKLPNRVIKFALLSTLVWGALYKCYIIILEFKEGALKELSLNSAISIDCRIKKFSKLDYNSVLLISTDVASSVSFKNRKAARHKKFIIHLTSFLAKQLVLLNKENKKEQQMRF